MVSTGRLRPRKERCEHHWAFWGKIAVGGLVGDAYICQRCPTTEILVHFGSQDELEKALEDGYQRLEERELKEGGDEAKVLGLRDKDSL